MALISPTEKPSISKFQSITHFEYFEEKHRTVPFLPGDHVVIMEKLDGANASFHEPEPGILHRYSKQEILNAKEDLRGFYNAIKDWTQGKTLNPNYRYFGEWLVPHKVIYEKEDFYIFYLYDVQDVRTGRYLPHEEVFQIASELGLRHAPVFFDGTLPDTQEEVNAFIQSFIGKTDVNASLSHKQNGIIVMGEGIVVRNQSRNRPDGKRIIVKYVVPEMAESRWNREYKEPKNVPETEFVVAHVTENRIEKILMKLVDESILPENWTLTEAKPKLSYLTERVVADVLDEHPVPEEFEEELIVKLIKKRSGGLAFPLLQEHQTQI